MFFEVNVWNSAGKKEYSESQLIKNASVVPLPLYGIAPGWIIEAKVSNDEFRPFGTWRSENVLAARAITATLFGGFCCVTDDAGNTYTEVSK